MSLNVRPISNGEVGTFINAQWNFYRNDPHWVAPLKFDRKKLLNTAKNPFYKHSDIQLFLAEDGGRVVGRIAAISNDNHNSTHEDNAGFFGFFECENKQETANALLRAAEEWLRGKGKDEVRGPVNPSMNDECAMLVDGFDQPAVVLMPYNPPYYPELLEKAGYAKAKDLYAYLLDQRDYRSPQLERMQELLRKRYNFTIREVNFKNKKQFEKDVQTIKDIYNTAWERNWGFVKMTDEEFDFLAADLKQVADQRYTFFVESDGKTAGFILALPDINQCLIHNKGGGLLGGAWHLLTKKKNISLLRIIVLGVLPEFRRTGADAVMYYEVGKRGLPNGITHGEASWVLEDNTTMVQALSRAMKGKHYKTYRIYSRSIEA